MKNNTCTKVALNLTTGTMACLAITLSAAACNWKSDAIFGKTPEEVETREAGYSYGGSDYSYSCTTTRSHLETTTAIFNEPGDTCSNPDGALAAAKLDETGKLTLWVYELEDGRFPAVIDAQFREDDAVIHFDTCEAVKESLVQVGSAVTGRAALALTEVQPEASPSPSTTSTPDSTATYKKMRQISCTAHVTTPKINHDTVTVSGADDPANFDDDSYEIKKLQLKNEGCESTATYSFDYVWEYNVPCSGSNVVYSTDATVGSIVVPRYVWADVKGI